MTTLLNIENLSIDFVSGDATTSALQNISLTINKGEIVAIVGESGSGKSVTALAVLQLLSTPPAIYKAGVINYRNNDKQINLLECSSIEIQQLRGNKIAMIFQEPMTSLNPVKNCGVQVAEAIVLHKKISNVLAKQQTIQLFKKVQLPDPEKIFYKYPHEISGGQKQRVMIAMAMSCGPDLLICDEPTTALDVSVQKNILLLIKQLQQQTNMGVIFISHDLGVVSEIADRVIVMYKGKIVEEGNTNEVLTAPKHPYTKALLACRPVLYKKGERLPVVSDYLQTEDNIKHQEDKAQVNDRVEINLPNPILNTQYSIIDQPKDLVSVEHLKVWYPAGKNFLGKVTAYKKAVDDVSFEIYKGETLGLVGESGCGKTTLGRALLGLLPATEGKIIFNGKALSDATAKEMRLLRKEMQIIFQDPYSSLNPRKKIGEAIAEPMLVHRLFKKGKETKEKVMELLKKVNLNAAHYDRYPHEFSGGQRQRIVIARALALEPSFVVCDESVSALDVSVQAQVLNLLNDLKKEFGFTALFISHDLSVIRYISDRIMVMKEGCIEECGNAEDIYNNPQQEYTRQLIDAIPGKKLIL
ncbi:ABC transporter ATP-binding protein [Panacibacter ginsenosidivorans]|uniref:ABC transporter ATP-binding protein n=1 Tax=Panacibacter ginsenosidivorans TaxID=1813871 RepID=A0A5B8VCW3_9BACT|nr:ABC transporter ATP-binding protein [Panacibacter ginsenosidivorans]QEC69109.1 ABC transporter ATP-binding protein [Panacibacter ginsenosidivorans]